MSTVLVALGLIVAASLAALGGGRRRWSGWIAAAGLVAAAAIAIPAAVAMMLTGASEEMSIAWSSPMHELHLGLDPLSAFFVVPLLGLGAACGIYGVAYLDDGQRAPGPPAGAFGLLLAAMLLVVLARDAVVFLIAWEVMTLLSYLLVTYDHHESAVRRAGWVFLIASHLGVACLIAFFLILNNDAGGLAYADFVATPATGATAVVAMLLAILGFGVKAGIVPLHVWLPEAHAAAPSHVSALMSGVLIKLGLYGLLRTLTFVAPMLWVGPVFAILGVVSAFVGIALALYQRDIKRAFAYSSIENVGVIMLGLGLGVWAATVHHAAIAAFALAGALLHIWNHALMKGLLFLGAGSVVHGSGTRDLEKMGGLLRRMPRTGTLLFAGALAIAALPPLAGFASEWLIYRGLLDGGLGQGDGPGRVLLMLFAIGALATIGVLAALCFVRIAGIALLGQPRSAGAAEAHESPRAMTTPMIVLAAGVAAMPLISPYVVRAFDTISSQIVHAPVAGDAAAGALAPIAWLTVALWIGVAVVAWALRTRTRSPAADDTWGCGYVAPTARMQYTSGSFAEAMLQLLPRALRARVVLRRDVTPFPTPGELVSDRDDPFTRSGYEPLLDRLGRRFAQLRWMQQGITHLYVLYIVVTVVTVLGVVTIYDWWAP